MPRVTRIGRCDDPATGVAQGDRVATTDQQAASVAARYSDFCAVAPHPELRDKWAAELDRIKKRSNKSELTGLGVQPKQRRLGLDDGVIVPPQEFPFGTPLSAISRAAADRAPLRGTVRVIVVLVQFSDKSMGASTSHFHDLFFSTGVLPHGSVKEYYHEVTNNLITLDGDVVGPYTMPQTLAWYADNSSGLGGGGNAFRSPQMAHDAAVAADPHVNFGPYDNDGNGFVDAFIVVHAGQGAEVTGSKGDIWSHKATLPSAYAADGTQIYGYLTIPEDAKIGVCSHELGHLLFGFPDLYDTDYSSNGIGDWCLMSGGSWNGGGDIPAHPCAWCKVNQGWVSSTVVSGNSAVTIPDVKTSHNVLRLWKDGASGAEYFLVENRQRTGYDADLPGDGLLLWHIDENQSGNTDENHYKVALLQADGHRDLEHNTNRGDAGDPYPGSAGNSSLNAGSNPNSKSYAAQDTCVSVTSISASGPTMSATIAVHCGKAIIKDVKETHKELKEGPKELKDTRKDQKELAKDLKDARKEFKEAAKELKDTRKEIKESLKESGKELKENLKESAKELKEGFKELKEFEKPSDKVSDKLADKPFNPPGGGGLGGGSQEQELSELEHRIAALEQVVSGAAAEPFIGSELRPDLIGGPTYSGSPDHVDRMAAGDAQAKREFDTPTT
jgi:immune inhibitor A